MIVDFVAVCVCALCACVYMQDVTHSTQVLTACITGAVVALSECNRIYCPILTVIALHGDVM